MKCLHSVVALSILSALLSGCDTLNWSQYRIAGVAPNTDDARDVAIILESVASRERMTTSTPKVNISQTFLCFSANLRPPLYMDLTTRYFRGDVLVDLAGPFGPKVPGFASTDAALREQLASTFGGRVTEPHPRLQ
jgi:hypothetical protein